MIVWLNGTFGAGKTATAVELLALLSGARMPSIRFPALAALAVAGRCYRRRTSPLHRAAPDCPQSVLTPAYLGQIFTGLQAARLPVFHVVLDADEATLRSRIEACGEAGEWRLDRLAEYRSARPWLLPAADLVVDTTALTPAQAAHLIADALPDLTSTPAD